MVKLECKLQNNEFNIRQKGYKIKGKIKDGNINIDLKQLINVDGGG